MIKLIQSTFYKEKETKKKLCAFIKKAKILSFGEECRKFETDFARYQGRKYCVFLNSGSSANLAIIQALLNVGKLKKGDAVGFSALTWSTNVMPLIELGLHPIPIDCELDTLNVSSRILLETMKKFPLKMLFLTNLLGFCDDIDVIADICSKKKIVFVEDDCESLGTVYKGKKLGNFGFAGTFSFYVGHHMSTIEGGAVCTDDKDLDNMLKIVRAHGWDRNFTEEKQLKIRIKHHVNETFYSRYTFYDLGYNLRTTEIQGFIANSQLPYVPEIVKKRQANFIKIANALYTQSAKYIPIRFSHIDVISNFAIPVICRTRAIRDDMVRKCIGKIEIRPIVGGDVTKQPFYVKYMGKSVRCCMKNAQVIHDQGLYVGNNPDLSDKETDTIISIFS